MIKLYQIRLTREEANRINAGEALAKHEAFRNAIFDGSFPGAEHYTHVADLDTDSLEGAFEIGNIGPEVKITRHDRMHSVSVGDVLVLDKRAYIVRPLGFADVEFPL